MAPNKNCPYLTNKLKNCKRKLKSSKSRLHCYYKKSKELRKILMNLTSQVRLQNPHFPLKVLSKIKHILLKQLRKLK